MIVVDASVLADALVDDGPAGESARAALTSDPHWAAPTHLLVEVMSVIRGKTLGGKLELARAEEAVAALSTIVIDYVETTDVIDRIWQLRDNITASDAAYVAAAEILDCPLVTSDARLAKSTGLRCRVSVVASA